MLLLVTGACAAPAQAKQVTLRLGAYSGLRERVSSFYEERVRLTLPDRGWVPIGYESRTWIDGRCHVDLFAQARAARDRGLERTHHVRRFTLPDRLSDHRVVYLVVDPDKHCAPGTAQPILRGAVLDGRRPACGAIGQTVLGNELVRVYDQGPWRKACARRSRHRTDLGFNPQSEVCYVDGCFIDHVQLVKGLVAYADESGGREGSSSSVVVVDALTGRTVLDQQAGRTCADTDYQAGPVESLVLRADGAVAWIVQDCSVYPPPTPYEVRTPAGVVAAGTDIVPASLQLAGDTITWAQGGVMKSAPF